MRNKVGRGFPWFLLCTLILVFFKNWFSFSEISAGDAPFFFAENLNKLPLFPLIWSTRGLGQFDSLIYPFPYFIFPIKILSFMHIPWVIVERVVWYWPFIFLSIFSSWFLVKTIRPITNFTYLAPLVYLFNTYILMIIGGGQLSIALSYAIFPLTLALFIKSPLKNTLSNSVVCGLILSLQLIFEPRIFILALAVVLSHLFLKYHFNIALYIKVFFVPMIIVLGINSYWILPLILTKKAMYDSAFSSSDWVGLLSFALFSNSFTLLHPLWPENIFGKVTFMKPEFLGVPILVYVSLLFVNLKSRFKDQNFNILFFAFLGLIGVFLAKGSNPPFGEIYSWLFNNVPGISMFRDPTKFYLLVALSFSVLIPFSVSQIYERINSKLNPSTGSTTLTTGSLRARSQKSKIQFNIQNYLAPLFVLLVIGYWLFLIRPAWLGQLGGTFKSREVPSEYVELKNFISSQGEFFRTFWVPRKQRFGFYSNNHPTLYAQEFVSPDVCQPPLCELVDESKKPPRLDPLVFPETEILDRVRNYSLSYFNNPDTHKVFTQMGVKYVIVPFDSEREIFLRDRKYSKEEQEKYITILDKVSWLKKVTQFEKNAVYETQNYQDHFFAEGEKIPQLKWEMVNPTQYKVEVKNADQPFTLVFSETYDDLWQAKIKGEIIPSKKIYGVFNNFQLDKKGSFDLTIEFTAQKYVWWGLSVSVLTLIISGFLLLRRNKK